MDNGESREIAVGDWVTVSDRHIGNRTDASWLRSLRFGKVTYTALYPGINKVTPLHLVDWRLAGIKNMESGPWHPSNLRLYAPSQKEIEEWIIATLER